MKIRVLILTLALLLPGISAATTVTINFDLWPNSDPINIPESPATTITDEFAEWGIIFESTTQIQAHGTPSDAPSPPNVLKHGEGTDGVTLDAYSIELGNPSVLTTVPWVEITQDAGAASGNNVLIAYDINGTEVDREEFNGSLHIARVEYVNGIHRVFANGLDGLDDLRFAPEPATVGLMALGIGGLLLRRTRRR